MTVGRQVNRSFIITRRHELSETTIIDRIFIRHISIRTIIVTRRRIRGLRCIFAHNYFVGNSPGHIRGVTARISFDHFNAHRCTHFINRFRARNIRVIHVTRFRAFLLRTHHRSVNRAIGTIDSAFRTGQTIVGNVRTNSIYRRCLKDAGIKIHFLATSVLLTDLRHRTRHNVTDYVFQCASGATQR